MAVKPLVVLKPLAKLLPLTSMIRRSGQPVFLPFYHAVESEEPLWHIRHLYRPVSVAQFEKHIDTLLTYFQPISLHDLILFSKDNRPVERPVFHLSFDDGLREIHDIVMPILLQKGIPATAFLNTGFLDNQALFYRYKASLLIQHIQLQQLDRKHIPTIRSISYSDRQRLDKLALKMGVDFQDFLTRKRPYMTSQEVNNWLQNGFTIGAHSVDHPRYEELTISQQLHQTTAGLDDLSNRFNLDYKAFAFPFTDKGVSSAFFEQIQHQLDLSFSTSGLKQDPYPFHLHRTPMEINMSSALDILKSEYLYYLLKSPFGKNTARH